MTPAAPAFSPRSAHSMLHRIGRQEREKGIQTAWSQETMRAVIRLFLAENGHRRKSEKLFPNRLKSRGGERTAESSEIRSFYRTGFASAGDRIRVPSEPKWDGFRCLVFRDEENVFLQSRTGKSLAGAFPEIVAAFRFLSPKRFAGG